MTCYHPVDAFRTPTGVVFSELSRYDIVGSIQLPCGQCIGCRLRRARDWTLRIGHEARLYGDNCFVTLTYGRDKLPSGGSLEYRDYQLFMKRLRKEFAPRRIRFFMCGEYGELNWRPHYHACLFNVDFVDRKPAGKSSAGEQFFDSEQLGRLWTHGRVSVQDLTPQTAAYCARYIVGKVTGEDAAEHYGRLAPEFSRCSLKPGIGAGWFERYGSDVYPHDFVVSAGQKFNPPRFYDRLKRRVDPRSVELDAIEFARLERARKGSADQTPERLAVREVVHKARVRNQKREF